MIFAIVNIAEDRKKRRDLRQGILVNKETGFFKLGPFR